MSDDEKLARLYKELARIDRKRNNPSSELEWASLLIDRRAVEEQIWALDKTLEER